MSDDRLQDIPSIKGALVQAKGLSLISAFLEGGRPLLRIFGIDVGGIDDFSAQIRKLTKDAAELAEVPDTFTDVFGERGWVVYDFLDLEAARRAISVAESAGVDAGEQILLDHYSSERIAWELRAMTGIQAFRPRMDLALLALKDFEAARYHASVPVVLALLDGMVSELGDRSFFSEGVDLGAYDSLAAHQRGLERLRNIFGKGRRTTVTEEISIPCRHGILHGRDLGYANRKVAVKSWVALFAAGDWARRVQSGRKNAPPEQPSVSIWREYVNLVELKEQRKRIARWKRRDLVQETDFPARGGPKDYEQGSPERALVEFLEFWKRRNYGRMSPFLYKERGIQPKRSAGRVRSDYSTRLLSKFEIVSVFDEAPAITSVVVRCWYESESEVSGDETLEFRMGSYDQADSPVCRGTESASWLVITWRHHKG